MFRARRSHAATPESPVRRTASRTTTGQGARRFRTLRTNRPTGPLLCLIFASSLLHLCFFFTRALHITHPIYTPLQHTSHPAPQAGTATRDGTDARTTATATAGMAVPTTEITAMAIAATTGAVARTAAIATTTGAVARTVGIGVVAAVAVAERRSAWVGAGARPPGASRDLEMCSPTSWHRVPPLDASQHARA